jgi:aminomethyltransferase
VPEIQHTPLHDWHVVRGGKMVDFAGWRMPVQYSGLVDEHTAVRERAGLFDVSHMGEIRLRGADALAAVQHLTVNDASVIDDGQAQYTAMVNEAGGIIDDLLVYRVSAEDYLLVVNAGTTSKDFEWITRYARGDVEVINESADWAQVALQGPVAESVLSRVLPDDLAAIRYYHFAMSEYGGQPAIISRTGYTGEDGFEIYLAPSLAAELADAIMTAGEPEGVIPAGLGARDTLRLEAGMMLYGNDMDETRSPIEAKLGWIVKLDKGEFIGRAALAEQKSNGTAEKIVALKSVGRGIPRHGYPILDAAGDRVGEVTSGTFSPTLREGIGMGYVTSALASADNQIFVEMRGKGIEALTVKPPFYRRER